MSVHYRISSGTIVVLIAGGSETLVASRYVRQTLLSLTSEVVHTKVVDLFYRNYIQKRKPIFNISWQSRA